MINQKNVTFILAILFVAAAGTSLYMYRQMSDLKNPDKVAKEEALRLVAKVGGLMVLPAGEEPTVATVADPSKLSDQPFFQNAKEGDKLMIYSQSQKVILYRPSENKIVEVSPVNLNQQIQNQVKQQPVETEATTTKKR